MFYIRTDANVSIATGHMMRCMSIAKELHKRGIDTAFIMADNEMESLIAQNGFSFIGLESEWSDLDRETEKLIRLIRQERIEGLLIDSYYVTKEYLEALRQHTQVLYIDDINQFIYPVDVLINYNNYYDIFHYEENYRGNGTRLLLGCGYVPLREEFQTVGKNTVRECVRQVLITTGGTDTYNVAGKLLTYICSQERYREITFHVIAGSLNPNLSKLLTLEARYGNIIIHQNVTKMSELMLQCDAAVSAGGSTMYELCACGIPTVTFSFADNQVDGVEGFSRKGIMKYAGDVRDGEEACIRRIGEHIDLYRSDMELRKELAARMQEYVDVKGVCKLADAIEEYCSPVQVRIDRSQG